MCIHEVSSRICVGKHSSHAFPVQVGVKQRDALSPLLFNFVLEYAIRKAKENQEGSELNSLNHVVYAGDTVCWERI
jgi:hypothetical protein